NIAKPGSSSSISMSDSGIGLFSSARCSQSTAAADSQVNQITEANPSNIIVTAIGRRCGLRPGPLSKNGAKRSAPKARPGMTKIPNIIYGPLAKSYFNSSYKNKKYQSGKGM